MIANAVYRMSHKHPLFRGAMVDPRYLPGKRKDESLLEFAQRATDRRIKDYLRDGLKWSRQHPRMAFDGFLQLDKLTRERT